MLNILQARQEKCRCMQDNFVKVIQCQINTPQRSQSRGYSLDLLMKGYLKRFAQGDEFYRNRGVEMHYEFKSVNTNKEHEVTLCTKTKPLHVTIITHKFMYRQALFPIPPKTGKTGTQM